MFTKSFLFEGSGYESELICFDKVFFLKILNFFFIWVQILLLSLGISRDSLIELI